MDWEKNWQNWRDKEDREYLVEQYGPIVGEMLANLPGTESARFKTKLCYETLWNHFDGEVPEEIQKKFCKDPTRDYILENLQTHNVEYLEREIEKKYGPFQDFEERGGKQGYLWWRPTNYADYAAIKDDWDAWREDPNRSYALRKIAEFYGYYITKVAKGYVQFEAHYPESATDFVQKDCRGHAYHLIEKDRKDTILKQGLRTKNGPTWDFYTNPPTRIPKKDLYQGYRYFPERIYLYATDTKGADLKQELERTADMVVQGGWANTIVLQVNVSGMKFYWDPAMHDQHSVFTYGSIPPNRIKVLH